MADAASQNLSKHTRWDPPFHFFVLPVFFITLVGVIIHVFRRPSIHSAWMIVVMLAAIIAVFKIRLYSLKVQDRVIRLEMRLRMQQMLPADLCERAMALTVPQLVALRFASDAELADLVRDVLAGKLLTQKAIKERVRTWAPDYLRA